MSRPKTLKTCSNPEVSAGRHKGRLPSEGRPDMAISKIATQPSARSHERGPDCTVCRALVELPKADAAGLLTMLRDKSLRFSEIADRIWNDVDTPEWVRKIAGNTYARHARAGCSARVNLR